MKAAVPSWRAFTPANSSESKPTCPLTILVHPQTVGLRNPNAVTQPHFSSLPAPWSWSLSRLADNFIDSATCQIHSADCSYKSNIEYLKTEFEFSNFVSSFNIPSTHYWKPLFSLLNDGSASRCLCPVIGTKVHHLAIDELYILCIILLPLAASAMWELRTRCHINCLWKSSVNLVF